MFAIIASDADNLRRPNCGQHAASASGIASIFRVRRLSMSPSASSGGVSRIANNGIAPGDWLNQSVMGLTIQLKSAVFHHFLSNHIREKAGGGRKNISGNLSKSRFPFD